MKAINVLSLFNGISCGRIALERAGIPVANYYESEIDKYAGKVSAYNWPDSIQIGDVRNVVVKNLPFVPDLLIAGSPCQGFSFAGKQLNFNDPRSALFFEFVRILKECRELNPNVLFLLENVPMKKEFQRVINEALGIYPVEINGALVSAQNRNRIFWSNIRTKTVGLFGDVYTDIPQPEDKGILLADILESEVDEKYFLSEKALARIERNTYSKAKLNPAKTGAISTANNSSRFSIDSGTTLIGVVNNNGKLQEVEQANCIDANYHKGMDNHGQSPLAVVVHNMMGRTDTSGNGGHGHLSKTDGKSYCHDCSNPNAVQILQRESGGFARKTLEASRIRRLTPTEVCRLFTIPDSYFHDKGGNRLVSESQQYKALGNGWVVDVIAHIFSFIKK